MVSILLAGVFFLNSAVYAMDLSKSTLLRNPLMTSNDAEDDKRLLETIIKTKIDKVHEELNENMAELTDLFEKTLSPLKNGVTNVSRIRKLFTPNEKEIYEIIIRHRELTIRFATLVDFVTENYFRFYLTLNRSNIDSPDRGLSGIIRDCLIEAMERIGLSPIQEDIIRGEASFSAHTYVKIKGKAPVKVPILGDMPLRDIPLLNLLFKKKDIMIVIDPATGQFIPENVGHVVVALYEEHDPIIREVSYKELDFAPEELDRLRKEFGEERRKVGNELVDALVSAPTDI